MSMSAAGSLGDEHLLVPTNLQACLVGRHGTEQPYDLAPVPRTQAELKQWYTNTGRFLPFDAAKLKSLAAGIHLHWAVPAALMHARYDDSGQAVQPRIPNRWLVLRMWRQAKDDTTSSRAWVIESDFCSEDNSHGGAPFPIVSGGDAPSVQISYIGRSFDLNQWRETGDSQCVELTGLGWGDPSFAANYLACKGVLGFHDDLSDLQSLNSSFPVDVTYLVLGWYSTGAQDPLNDAAVSGKESSLAKRLQDLRWACPGAGLEDKAPPAIRRTLCHGSVVGIQWPGADATTKSAAVKSDPAGWKVAIGGNMAEAFAALLAHEKEVGNGGPADLERVLCAFQHGQAMQVADADQLTDLLDRHGFAATPGGKRWALEPTDRSRDARSAPPPLSHPILSGLDALNLAQRKADRLHRQAQAMLARHFDRWVRWASEPRRLPSEVFNTFRVGANPGLLEVEEARRAVDSARLRIEEGLASEQTGMQLVESAMPPFLQPKDPFVVLDGGGMASFDRTGSAVKDDGILRCRTPGEVTTGAQLSGVVSRDAAALNLSLLDPSCLSFPDLLQALALEALFFDPHYAAALVGPEHAQMLETLQRSFENKAAIGNDTLSWEGSPPDRLGITHWSEKDPLLPVFMMWQLYWKPDHVTSLTEPKVGDEALLEGSTLISTLSGQSLAKSFEQFAASAGLDSNVRDNLESKIVLGQSLGGLNELLLRLAPGLRLPPINPHAVDDAQVDAAAWKTIGRSPQAVVPRAFEHFLPIRGGTLKLVNLYLVDTFGRVNKLIESAHTTQTQAEVIVSAALLPDSNSGAHAKFRPQLVQPQRLNIDWRPADEQAPGPVCGWIVPNFLNKSLMVYAASGELLGSLQSALAGWATSSIQSTATFTWQGFAASKAVDIHNQRLGRFVSLVENLSADEGQAFLELVELVLRRTDERTPPDNPATRVLLGRPLALVHACIQLELQGLPAGYWELEGRSSFTFNSEVVEGLRVAVQLGGMKIPADGLVGYLRDGAEADGFFASTGASKRLNESDRIKYDQSLELACADESAVLVNLLMEVGASVHATTGILPRTSVSLPPEVLRQAASIKEAIFGVAPVLSENQPGTPSQPTMPRPSDAFGQWTWATRPGIAPDKWHDVQPTDDRAHPVGDLVLSEGWLRLRLQTDVEKKTEAEKP